MIALLLVLIPTLVGLGSFFIRSHVLRRTFFVLTSLCHFLLTVSAWVLPSSSKAQGWFFLDPLGHFFLTLTSLLFLASSFYCLRYLKEEGHGRKSDFEEGLFFVNAPEAVFTGCMLLFLAAMTLVTVSQHFGLLWVAIEATTLASAPLIYFHRHHRSLEATWKYLLICSVGIALALIGNFFLTISASDAAGKSLPLVVDFLTNHASALHRQWLKAAFIFLLVGYGTKMGLAPLHTWLPDAHSEAPSVVSALLSGALLNCAFLGILRAYGICVAAGESQFANEMLLGFGLLSMAVAAIFILGQIDFKRMLAYSSVEHMGIMALGVGIGGAGSFGALLHALNHSLTKAMLFFLAGNILRVYKTKSVAQVQGLGRVLPVTGILWFIGFLAITGSPPFGIFLSELTILKAALDGGRLWVSGLYLAFLALIFIGMATIFLAMVQGRSKVEHELGTPKESLLTLFPIVLLGVATLILGIYLPPHLSQLLHQLVQGFGGVSP